MEAEEDIAALREASAAAQDTAAVSQGEVEEERLAPASAASRAMAMMLRQREKAELIRGMMGLGLGLFGCLHYGCFRVRLGLDYGMGRTCVYVHHVDKDAFFKGNIDPNPDELDMVFDLCPSYGELLEQVRKDLNWMDPSDVVEFDDIPAPINEEANIEPLSCVHEANEEVNIEHEPLVEANDEHDDDENDGNILQDNNLGDLDK
ncbi:hypothetical protein D1007_52260 [Hordeum vulgare]|nr:hypothetical protein D1007_52260 [Hordeum vulgare]